MARLADRIWELRWVPPQVLCYRPEFRSEAAGGFSYLGMKAFMEAQRDRIARSPVYAADAVGRYFFTTAPGDRTLAVQDFPAVAIPEETAFIEFRRPALADVAGGEKLAAELPHWWGWQVSKHPPAEFARVFRARDAVQPGCAAGLLCILWMSPDDKTLFAPMAALGLQVAGDGELLGPPTMALGFESDPDRVADARGLFGYINVLFLPAVMAMAFLACASTTARPQAAEAALNRARVRRRKRPFVAHATIEFEPIRDVLRHQGLAGVQGLAAALRQCRSHFVQDMRGQSSLILLPGGG
jgi:hypothetical protein